MEAIGTKQKIAPNNRGATSRRRIPAVLIPWNRLQPWAFALTVALPATNRKSVRGHTEVIEARRRTIQPLALGLSLWGSENRKRKIELECSNNKIFLSLFFNYPTPACFSQRLKPLTVEHYRQVEIKRQKSPFSMAIIAPKESGDFLSG